MSFKFECPYCGQHILADTEMCGAVGTCPACEQSLTIPALPEGRLMGRIGDGSGGLWGRLKSLLGGTRKQTGESLSSQLFRAIGISVMVIAAFSCLLVVIETMTRRNTVQPTVVLQPSPAPAPARIESLKVPEDREAYAAAIERVNKQLLQLHESNEEMGRITDPSMLEYMFVHHVSEMSRIPVRGCPDDFVTAWKRYVTATAEMLSALRAVAQASKASGGRFRDVQEADAGVAMGMGLMITIAQLESAEKGLESTATRYGVKWAKMSR